MTGAKSAATDIKSKNQKELADAKDALEKWLILINKRNNSLNLEPTRPLISHEKLFASINNIAKDFGYNKLSFKSDIFLIKNQCHEVLTLLSQNNEDTSTRLIELNGAKPLVTEYISVSKQATERRQSITLQLETKTQIEYIIRELNIGLLNEEKNLIYMLSVTKELKIS